jgi:Type III flagellar switch regulator (C-ring) FliN C-term
MGSCGKADSQREHIPDKEVVMSSKNLERWFPRLQVPIESIFEQWVTMASQRVSERLGCPVEFSLQGASIEDAVRCASGTESDSQPESQPQSQSESESDCECQLEFDGIEDPWSLRLDMPSVYRMIDGLLGSTSSEPDGGAVSMRDIDWRIAKMALEDLVEPCVGLWLGGVPGDSDRGVPKARVRLLGDSELVGRRLARVRIEFQIRMSGWGTEGSRSVGHVGRGAWLLPESLLVDQLGRLLFGGATLADLSVVLATSRIACSELSELEVGDIISTEQIATGRVEVQSLGGLLYRAEAGVFRGQRAIRLTGVQPDRPA